MQTTKIKKIDSYSTGRDTVVLTRDFSDLLLGGFPQEEKDHLKNVKDEQKVVHFNHSSYHTFYIRVDSKADAYAQREAYRLSGAAFKIDDYHFKELTIIDLTDDGGGLFFAEGLILSSYKFHKYKTEKKESALETVFLSSDKTGEGDVELMNIANEAVYTCRDLVNEPYSTLNAHTMAEYFKKMGEDAGAKVEVFNKRKIESLKMGGLLAVNKGSDSAPTFSLMTWKPEGAVNEKPIVLVGKGVVFDTGGLNIKTGDFMYDMRMDMGGAAAVATAFWAVAKAKLPVYLVALVPATDNRPGGEAYAPGDIITMHNGKTVEVINTDAEGRMILADALSYASKFKPEMVIDLATLTGAAARAVGKQGIAAMHNDDFKQYNALSDSGFSVYERLVRFPMWDEYGESIKSEFADIKNLGGAEAGMITAAKFLENFVDYPWVHLDIAGPAILSSKDAYRTKGGSGTGTRLLFDFIKTFVENKQK